MQRVIVGQLVPALLADAIVRDPRHGREQRLGAAWATRDAVVVFVRHFGCAGCSAHVGELRPRLAELAQLGVGVALVGSGSPEHLAAFVAREQLAGHPIDPFTDPTRAAYLAADLERSWLGVVGPRALGNLASPRRCAAIPNARGARRRGPARRHAVRRARWPARAVSPRGATRRSRAHRRDVVARRARGARAVRRRSRDPLTMILFHLANALYLVSYAVRDILWLRVITVLAGLALIASFLRRSQSAVAPAVAWNCLFFIINIVRIHLLILERRPIPLSADQQQLQQLVFRTLRPRELVRLLRIGRIVDHPTGARVIQRGEPLADLLLVIAGTARVELGDKPAIEIADGAFIGEMSYLTGKAPGADVIAATPLRIVHWPTADLRAFLDTSPELSRDDAAGHRRRPRDQSSAALERRDYSTARVQFSVTM